MIPAAYPLALLAALAALAAAAYVVAPLWDAVRRRIPHDRLGQLVAALMVVVFAHYGSTKSKITFDGGIRQNRDHPSFVTNGTISLHWERDSSQGTLVPLSAAVYIDYRPNTATNEEWGLLAQATVGDFAWEGLLPDATNYDYNVWAYYIPPAPVHTNGVWLYKTMPDRSGANVLPLHGVTEVNGEKIAPPDVVGGNENDNQEDSE